MTLVHGLAVRPEDDFEARIGVDFATPIRALNPINDGGTGWSGINGGVPVDGADSPKTVIYGHPRKRSPADFENAYLLTVSAKAREVIERLELSVHQFFSVEFLSKGGASIEHRYWFVVCNRIDSVDRTHTTMVLWKGKVWRPVRDLVRRGEPIPPHLAPDTESRIVFNNAAIGGAHLWKDKHLDGGGVNISHDMFKLFVDEGLTGLDFSPRHQCDAV